MHSTNTATTIANVYSDEPNARPLTRITTVWSTIIAKPTSSAVVPYTAKMLPASGAAASGSSETISRRRRLSSANTPPAATFTQPSPCSTPSSPSHSIRKKPVASAPRNAPAVFQP
jgi:hypothetical protein